MLQISQWEMKIRRKAVTFRHSGWWKKLSSVFHIDGVWGCAGRTLNKLSRLWEQANIKVQVLRARRIGSHNKYHAFFTPNQSSWISFDFIPLTSLRSLKPGLQTHSNLTVTMLMSLCNSAAKLSWPLSSWCVPRWGLAGRCCWSMEGLLWLARSRVARHTLLHDDWEGD